LIRNDTKLLLSDIAKNNKIKEIEKRYDEIFNNKSI